MSLNPIYDALDYDFDKCHAVADRICDEVLRADKEDAVPFPIAMGALMIVISQGILANACLSGRAVSAGESSGWSTDMSG
jgi:hypothetical protein